MNEARKAEVRKKLQQVCKQVAEESGNRTVIFGMGSKLEEAYSLDKYVKDVLKDLRREYQVDCLSQLETLGYPHLRVIITFSLPHSFTTAA